MRLTKKLFTCLVLMTSFNVALCQEVDELPVNYAGLHTAIDLNTLTAGAGIGYERLLCQTNKKGLDVQAVFSFPARSGNLNFISGSDNTYSTRIQLQVNGYLFTSQRRPYGFFVKGSLGISRSFWYGPDVDRAMAPYKLRITNIGPGAGFGWHFMAGKKLSLRWANDLSFSFPVSKYFVVAGVSEYPILASSAVLIGF